MFVAGSTEGPGFIGQVRRAIETYDQEAGDRSDGKEITFKDLSCTQESGALWDRVGSVNKVWGIDQLVHQKDIALTTQQTVSPELSLLVCGKAFKKLTDK